MEIRRKSVSELTPTEYRACYLANYGDEGYMRETLVDNKKSDDVQVILFWDGPDDTAKSLMAWCMLTPVTKYGLLRVTDYVMKKSKYSVQFWVKRQYRRKGHGKALMLQVKEHYDINPHVMPHDDVSAELFGSFNVQILKEDSGFIKRGKPKVA